MKLPTFGTGKMAPFPIVDTQGFGIPAKAKDPETAAKFIDFMHSPERLKANWTMSKQIPADARFNPAVIDNPLIKPTYNTVHQGEAQRLHRRPHAGPVLDRRHVRRSRRRSWAAA